jgi:diacylglycerol kinase family enzyme
MSTISYIINPAGHGGAGIKVWERMQSEWPDQIDSQDVHFTERQGHAREIARSIEGYDILAAVGGDGTVGEILSGIMDTPEPHPKLAIIPAGTGNDIGRNLGIFSFEDAMDALHDGHARKLDLVRIDCQVDGQKAHRYSFLVGTVGFSAQPMVKPWMKRFLGPTGAYYLGTILQVIVYRPPTMTIRWGEEEYCERTWMVIIGNIERTAGGSMCLAPGAHPEDGLMHTSIIPVRSKLNLLAKMMPQKPPGQNDAPDCRRRPRPRAGRVVFSGQGNRGGL